MKIPNARLQLFLLLLLVCVATLPFISRAARRTGDSRPQAQSGAPLAGTTAGVISVSLTGNDLSYNPSTQTLYASVPSSAPNFANTLVPINPITGALGTPVSIGSNPSRLAASDDNQFLYVSLQGAGSVRRYDIQTQALGPEFSLGTSGGETVYAGDLQVMPGNPNALAIAKRTAGLNQGVAIYDNGVPRPNQITNSLTADTVLFKASGEILYGVNNTNTGADFYRFSVSNNGLTLIDDTQRVITGSELEFANGIVYSQFGAAYDPEAHRTIGQFLRSGSVAVDASNLRVYFARASGFGSGFVIEAFDTNTFLPIASLTITEGSGGPGSLTLCNDRLAFRTSGGQLILVQSSALQPVPPTPLPSPVVGVDGVIKLSVATNDLVFDQGTQKIYASVPSNAGSFGNGILPIDPSSGNPGTPKFLGSEPDRLAVSDNNQYIYAGLDGAGAVRRFDLGSQAAGLQFSLGFSGNGPLSASDLGVQPGNPNVVAVSKRNRYSFPGVEDLAIYDNGIKRPNILSSVYSTSVIEFSSSPSILYGYGFNDFLRLSVDSSGVTFLSRLRGVFADSGDFKYSNGMIYGTNGQVFDPEGQALRGAFPVNGYVAPDPTNGRVYFLNKPASSPTATIWACDSQTFVPVGFYEIAVSGNVSSFIRWGADGLAFRTSGNQVFLLHTSILHPYIPANPIFTTRPDGVRQLSLPAYDIVYNPSDHLIYAGVPSAAGGSLGNTITSIDPVAGAVGPSTFIGSEPIRIALSDTGDTLYASLGGIPAVRRFNVPTRTPGVQFGLGSDIIDGAFWGYDLAVAPGNPDLVAVVTYLPALQGTTGIVLTNNGTVLPHGGGGDSLAFSGSYLYTYSGDSSEFGLRRLSLNSDGFSELGFATNVVQGFGQRIVAAGGRIFGSDGAVADPSSLNLLGKFTRSDPGVWVAAFPEQNRIYFLGLHESVSTSLKVTAYDTQTYLQVGSLTLQNIISSDDPVSRFIRYGTDGLAFNTRQGHIYFLNTGMITPLSPTPIPTPVQVTPEIKRYSLSTGDLIYSPTDGMIYASVPSRVDGLGPTMTFGNSIAPINPVTGVIGQPLPAGSEPKKLAISGNGRYIYAALDGAGAVCRLDVATQTVGNEFSLFNDQPFKGPRYVQDMEVSPDNANTLAISRKHKNGTPSHLGVAIYDNGVQRATTTENLFTNYFDNDNVIEYSKSPATIYGLNLEASTRDFHKLTVNSSGVVRGIGTQNLFDGSDFEFDNGLLYSDTGQVVNPVNATLVGTVTGLGFGDRLVRPDSATGRVFYLASNNGTATIRAYDINSLALTGTLSISGIQGQVGSFIRWGSNGFAFKTNSNQLFIIQSSSLVPPLITNAIDDSRTFVRQHYLDFLNRNPDQGGWDYWTAQITQCGIDPYCIHQQRIGVSAAFFIELEFQQTGYVVYRFYRAAYGTNGPGRANVTFAQFIADRAQLVGGAGLPQNTITFANAFVSRSEFKAAYPDSMTNAEFVNKLFDTASLTPYATERQQQIDAMNNNGKTRAQVLLDVIEIPGFKAREYNPAFVLMQYFGYLRRNPDQGGYDFWLNVLNSQPNNFRGMVCSFLTSTEYQQRFGTAVTRSNQDCSP